PDAAPIHSSTELKFPTDFAWGVSTPAVQIEGSLAADGRGPSIWDNVNGGVSRSPPDPAASHYRLWHEDIRLLQMLGVSAYRYSIAWPRLFPKASAPLNEAGLAFMTDSLMPCSRSASNHGCAWIIGTCQSGSSSREAGSASIPWSAFLNTLARWC